MLFIGKSQLRSVILSYLGHDELCEGVQDFLNDNPDIHEQLGKDDARTIHGALLMLDDLNIDIIDDTEVEE